MFEEIGLETVKAFLSEAGRSDLTEKIIVFSVAWFFVKRTIKDHFGKIENSLSEMSQGLKQLNQVVSKMESTYTVRLGDIEDRIKVLESK